MKKLFTVFLSFGFLFLTGCTTAPVKPMFAEAITQNLKPPPEDKAQIVFLEPINSIQGFFPVALYDVTDDNRSLLAITGAHSKAVVLLAPGHHRLMSFQGVAAAAHYLDANVEAGKRYYVLVRFIYGQGFQLRPLRTSASSDYSILSKDFPSWISSTRLVEKTQEGEAHFERLNDKVTKSQNDGRKNWLAKSDRERAELTLGFQDSVDDFGIQRTSIDVEKILVSSTPSKPVMIGAPEIGIKSPDSHKKNESVMAADQVNATVESAMLNSQRELKDAHQTVPAPMNAPAVKPTTQTKPPVATEMTAPAKTPLVLGASNTTVSKQEIQSSQSVNQYTPKVQTLSENKPEKYVIQMTEFRLGTSSVSVERLAKERACIGGVGAGLITPKGAKEIYRMNCSDGRVLIAQCELRQCAILKLN